MLDQGGIRVIRDQVAEKAVLFYDYIDGSKGFYINNVEVKYRSRVSIPFRICDNSLMEKKFAEDATKNNLHYLAGHELMQACRACFYTAMPLEGV